MNTNMTGLRSFSKIFVFVILIKVDQHWKGKGFPIKPKCKLKGNAVYEKYFRDQFLKMIPFTI